MGPGPGAGPEAEARPSPDGIQAPCPPPASAVFCAVACRLDAVVWFRRGPGLEGAAGPGGLGGAVRWTAWLSNPDGV